MTFEFVPHRIVKTLVPNATLVGALLRSKQWHVHDGD
jgi:hypothetical protein